MSLIMEAIKKAQQMRGQGNQSNSWSEGILGAGNSLKKNRGGRWIIPLLIGGGIFIGFILATGPFALFSSSPWRNADKVPPKFLPPPKSQEDKSQSAEREGEIKLARAGKEEKPPEPSSAKGKTEIVERSLLPLTVVAMPEPPRTKEVIPEKEISPRKAEEKLEVKDTGAERSIVREKKEEEEKTEKATKQEQEKPKASAPQEIPVPEIKVEKLTGEIKSSQEAVKNFNAGVNFYQQRNLGQALQAYKKALQYDGQFLEAYNNLALIYQELGDLDQARETLQKATQINPQYEKAWNNLGIILLLQNRYSEAKEVFQKTLQINPRHGESYLNLGVIYRQEGELRKAAECYQKALQLNPERGEAHYNLAIIWEELNDLPRAISHYRSFLHLAAKDYPALAAEVNRHINRLGKEQKRR